MNRQRQLKGLYAITPPHSGEFDTLLGQVAEALAGGARIIQYRNKQAGDARRKAQAIALRKLCHEQDALLIINDDPALAKAVGADGVHVGKQDGDVATARHLLGRDAVIGISCYNQLSLAIAAERAGADYVAFGRFFPSVTKPDAVQAEIPLLSQAKQILRVPVVAIGGITPENGGTLIQAGADMLAVINGLFGMRDIAASCHQFTRLFDTSESIPS